MNISTKKTDEIFFMKILAFLIAAERSAVDWSAVDFGDFTSLLGMTSLKVFVTALAGHVASSAARLG